MMSFSRKVQVWAYTRPADLRKGYNGLYGLVTGEMQRDPLSGDCFLFVNRNRNRCKVLVWDGTGLCIYMKRLERGRFAALWGGEDDEPVRLTQSELSLFLEGCTIVGRVPLSPEETGRRTLAETGSA
jgi:transposase